MTAVLDLSDLADRALLQRAFDWLCRRRREYPASAGVWTLRRRWGEEKRRLQAELRSGHYKTQPLRRVAGRDGERLSLWSARDALVLKAPTRWKLRRAVKAISRVLERLGLEKHRSKTFVGRVERGFDFLGYRFSPQGLEIAAPTRARFVERATRLYEQERGKARSRLVATDSERGRAGPRTSAEGGGSRGAGCFPGLREYVRRWLRWTRAGLPVGAVSVGSVLVGSSMLFVFGAGGVVVFESEVH